MVDLRLIHKQKTVLITGDEEVVPIIVTPRKSIAMCYGTLNQFGEYGSDFPYTGMLLYRDANNDHWLKTDNGKVVLFDIETLTIID